MFSLIAFVAVKCRNKSYGVLGPTPGKCFKLLIPVFIFGISKTFTVSRLLTVYVNFSVHSSACYFDICYGNPSIYFGCIRKYSNILI